MRILLSNDDGYLAPGLACLARALSALAQVDVVAPERDRSGASNSLTLDRPLRVRRGENGFLYVDGTPTDCVHLAITGLMAYEPDMVIAGINRGANLGDDVLYSGTVAAAMEGRFLGVPAIAVSLVIRAEPEKTVAPPPVRPVRIADREPQGPGETKGAVFAWADEPQQTLHYETAARVAVRLVEQLMRDPLPADTILNVNVPNVPYEDLSGIEVTRLGHRHKSEPVIPAADPHGRPVYWIGPSGPEADAGPGTDFDAIRRRAVSITPLSVDLTRYTALEQVSSWLKKL